MYIVVRTEGKHNMGYGCVCVPECVCVIHVSVCYTCANVRIKSFLYNWRVEKYCF